MLTNTKPTQREANAMVDAIVNTFSRPFRSPVLGTPADLGLVFEEVTFPSRDGVPLEGWFIPRSASNKLVICNHPLWFSRTGFPAHLEPWRSVGAAAGNDFEVNYMQDYKILHDAGYNVLTYDLRNFGLSGAANGGVGSNGVFESRDVIGSLIYARSREDLRAMTIGLFSRCMGCNATMIAMQKAPQYFTDIRCMVAPEPISLRANMVATTKLLGIPERLSDIERRVQLIVSRKFDEMSPIEAAKHVKIPTFIYSVHDDPLTDPSDVQIIYDNIPTAEKYLHWIRNTTHRWDGYLYFQREPAQMLAWFAKFMA
jgi:uncharacterized protein